jgi:hypothetical protein
MKWRKFSKTEFMTWRKWKLDVTTFHCIIIPDDDSVLNLTEIKVRDKALSSA